MNESSEAPSPHQFAEHLREIKDSIQGAVKATPAKEPPDPKRNREYTFDFSYTDPHGEIWCGQFTNQILTIAQRIQMGTIRARMQAGVPVEAFTQITFDLICAIAWMQLSLGKRPKWAEDLSTLIDEELVLALFEEVRAHENTFRERKAPAPTSEGKPS